MPKKQPESEHFASVIRTFVLQHGIRYSWFERLRTRRTIFRELNERRLRDWVPLDSAKSSQRKPQGHTRLWLEELANWISGDEEAVLRALRVKRSLPRIDEKTLLDSGPPRHDSLTVMEIGSEAIRHATLGYSRAALELVTTAFARRLNSHSDQAMGLLPTILYLLYRYFSPHEMSQAVSRLCEQIKKAGLNPIGENPDYRDLSLSQIACALNERGHGRFAGQLFFCPEVRRLSEFPLTGIWPKTQLIRNVAVHWALHGHRASEAIAHVREADGCDSKNHTNLRAGATVCCQTYFTAQKSHCAKAWELIEPYYDDSRERLITAAESEDVDLPDALHLYSGLYYGALAKCLSRKRDPSRSQLAADIHALQWCQSLFGPIHVDDALVTISSRSLPPELDSIRRMSLRPALTDFQAEPFLALRQLLLRNSPRATDS